MDEHEWLAEQFEANRTHLRAVAYRMLGSLSEADDAVQEGWLRLSRSDTSGVENLRGWLTTVVARVCLGHAALAQVAPRGVAGCVPLTSSASLQSVSFS
jgi:DNA-directed RNA polymerase specialized sigma24 family protein